MTHPIKRPRPRSRDRLELALRSARQTMARSQSRAEDHGGKGVMLRSVGKKAAGRHLDGVLPDAFPEVRS